MANKQTLPNTQRFQESYINTNGAPQLPSIDYKSPLRGIAGVIEQARDFENTYTKLRYEGYQAQGTKLMSDMAHAMEDAKDPCELEDIRRNYESQLNRIGGDDIFGKSYRKSQYFTNFKNKWDINAEKMYLNRMHAFEEIAATANAQDIANAVSESTNPDDIYAALRSYDSSLAGITHMTAEKKYNLLNSVLDTTLDNVVSLNPDTAEAFVNKYGDELGEYGLDKAGLISKIRTKKLQDYRLQRSIDAENRRIAREAKKEAEDNAKNQAYETALKYKFGEINADEVYAQARVLNNSGYPQSAFTLMDKAFPKSKSVSQKLIATENIGNRINALSDITDDEEKKIEIENINQEITKQRNLGRVDDNQAKFWQSQISGSDKVDLSSVQDRAENGLMTPADYNFLDKSVSNKEITETQRDAVVRMNDRNRNVAQYKNQITNNEITTDEQIDKLPLTDQEIFDLKGILSKHREKMGYGTPVVDDAYTKIDNRDYQGLMKIWKQIPPQKRQPILEAWEKAIELDQVHNFEELENQIPTGKLTVPVLNKLYKERQINATQYKTLVADLEAEAVRNVRNSVGNIAKDILNGVIKTEEQLRERYNEIDPRTQNYTTNKKLLDDLLKKETEPYRNVLNNAFKIVDRMMTKDILGNNTAISVQKAAETKAELLKIFNQYMEDKNITLDKMQSILSPNNVARMADVNQVTFLDLSQSYSKIGVEYNTDEMVNVMGNIDLNNIPQINADDFIIESDNNKEQAETNQDKNKETVADVAAQKASSFMDFIFDYLYGKWENRKENNTTTPQKNNVLPQKSANKDEDEGLLSKDVNTIINDENVELELL